MRNFLSLFGVVALVACITDPTPGRSPYCYYAGDTIGYEVVSLGGVAIVCDWRVQKVDTCKDTRVGRLYGQADCVEGEKWPRR